MPTTFVDGAVLTGPALTAALATATADAAGASPVSRVAGRTGDIVLTVADVSGAYASSNPASYITAASPALTGTPTVPTATTGTNTTQAASCAFVNASVVASTTGVATFNTRTGSITLTSADVTSALTFAPYNATNPSSYQTLAQVRGGTTTNDNASSGQIGEYIISNVAIGSAISLTNATLANITSMSLTAGDWDVSGLVTTTVAGGTTTTSLACSASLTSVTQAPIASNIYPSNVAGAITSMPLPTTRLSLASTTTVYLVVAAQFAVSTLSAYGFIAARRAR